MLQCPAISSKLLMPHYIERGAQGFVCVFDFSQKSSFQNLSNWIVQIKQQTTVENPTILVLGNKRDLEHKEITAKEVADFQAMHRDVIFMETSARTGYQVVESFKNMGQIMIEKGNQVKV